MTRIFLSYASHDSHLAERMAREIEQIGVQVWWDRSSLNPGESFEDAIDQAIAEADRVVVMWTETSVRSAWVRAEAREGLVRNVLLPVFLETARLPLTFRGLHTLDLTEWANSRSGQRLPEEFIRACKRVPERAGPTPGLFGYQCDITICLDLGPSMQQHLRRVKRELLEFQPNISAAAENKGKDIVYQSVKLIAYSSPGGPLLVTRFMDLLTEEDQFISIVTGLRTERQTVPESRSPGMPLKALELAIRGPWPAPQTRRVRQIILVWTDQTSRPGDVGGYGSTDFDQLTDLWEGPTYISHAGKRLVIYAPDGGAWTDIANHWDNALHLPGPAGEGMENVELQEIVDIMINSI